MAVPLSHIPEGTLQYAVQDILSNPSKQWSTNKGARIQVLAPGRINIHEGPDFLDMAIMLNGNIIVGHGEFHRTSSDWDSHNHSSDPRYSSVILHIVLQESPSSISDHIPTLILDSTLVESSVSTLQDRVLTDVQEVHTYSLLRLLRMTAEHKEYLKNKTPAHTFAESVKLFLHRYEKKRRRPAYTTERLAEIANNITTSVHARVVDSIYRDESIDIPKTMNTLIDTPLFDEGEHLRREIIVNSFVPCVLAVAGDEIRISVFTWYWSVQSLNEYGVLDRFYPDMPQQYLWQQQGMLEMLREKNANTSAHEAVRSYGLMHTLHFYKLALESPEIQNDR